MNEDAEAKSHAGRLSVVIVGALLLYVLSIGPVVAIVAKSGLPHAWVKPMEILYAPLIWVCEHTRLRVPMEHYVGWWLDVFHISIE